MFKYRLIVIWEDQEDHEEYDYDSEEKAYEAEHGFYMVFGKQIRWTCVKKVFI